MNQMQIPRRRERRMLARLLAVAAIGLPLAACDTEKLLEVKDPATVPPEAVTTPEAATSLGFGALRDFNVAYSGAGDDAFIISSGVLSDELYNGDTFTTRINLDQRNLAAPVFGNVPDVAYSRLHRARFAARRAAVAVLKFTGSTTDFALLRTIEAYTYVTLGEGWCGNVPFSTVPDSGAIDPTNITYKAGIGTLAIMDSSIVRFNEALANNPANNLAKVGKARALMNKGGLANMQAAAAAVATIPLGYVYLIEHSPNASSENNPIYSLQNNGRYGVSNLEGATTTNAAGATVSFRPDSASSPVSRPNAEGLAFRGLRDPRVPWTGPFTAFTGSFRKYLDQNNPSYEADVPLASGVEARLIVAEYLLRSGSSAWLDSLNVLRANAEALVKIMHPQVLQTFSYTLAPLTDPGTPDARLNLLMQERALWLYGTGHRLGDLRRLVRDYGRPSNTVFPSGPFYRGGSYGNDVAFSVRFEETNNPNYVASQCVTTQA
jgi:hypothetical protein